MNYRLHIVSVADNLINKYGTRNPHEIADGLGINILPVKFVKQKGVYKVIKKNRFIFINESLDEIMTKIVLFHEIGHDQLHRNTAAKIGFFQESELFGVNSNRMEYEANLFAAEILIPTSEILEQIEYGNTVEQIAKSMYTDKNLVALKIELLCSQGYKFTQQDYKGNFLKY